MKKLVIGILAHVDAGKTTLAESILYLTGKIRKLGRVDHRNAFLDTFELERARGITIFSKQAVFSYKDVEVTLLDTPGHVDFSAEMERTLQVLDYAILVISGSDGVQGHTETLWRLLKKYRIPTFLFVNKMDLDGTDRNVIMTDLKKRLHDGCINFCDDFTSVEFQENLAMCDETLLERYMERGKLDTKDMTSLIIERKVFPCYFGSALRVDGVQEFLDGLERFTQRGRYGDTFGAKVYKIARDEQGNRLTYMKITGGSLKVKMLLTNRDDEVGLKSSNIVMSNQEISSRKRDSGEYDEGIEVWEEKVNQIRIYSGSRYEAVDEVEAGAVCAVTGLNNTYPGEGLGMESVSDMPILQPVLNYRILLPPQCDAHITLMKLRQLEEEDPQLHIVWSEQLKEIHVQLMGEVQIDVLKNLIKERFDIEVEFGTGNIVYKETISDAVVGAGHFEPLRHYAEVHLLLEPLEPGSGLILCSDCSEDLLDRNWQRLVITHLEEKVHKGVLTGSPITDMKITLIAGRAHKKHTEGGDFRQATYRAVRQGLKKANSVLLEPFYQYKLEVPSETVGRAMSDIQRMHGTFNPPEMDGEMSVLTGNAPVATMRGYLSEVTAYTKGRGRLFCTLRGYYPCHNTEQVIDAIGYDSERDLDNPTGSVFCAHGAGFTVEWDKVEEYMHLNPGWEQPKTESLDKVQKDQRKDNVEAKATYRNHSLQSNSFQEDKELEAIFTRTFGPIKQRLHSSQNRFGHERKSTDTKVNGKQYKSSLPEKAVKEYLLVDGYNIIYSWDELNELAMDNMDSARTKLMDILCNYQGFKQCIVILVFDAYKVKGGVGTTMDYHNIHVVYTKEAETADEYIEKVTHDIAKDHRVTVATSDALEQLIIMGQGAMRLSANDLKDEILRVGNQIRMEYLERHRTGRSFLGEKFTDNVLDILKEMDQDTKE